MRAKPGVVTDSPPNGSPSKASSPSATHQRIRRKGPDPLGRLGKCFEERLVARFPGKRQVEIVAEARPFAALAGMAPEEGIEADRVGMDRHGQHIGAGVEDALRAVAVVQVDIEYRNARRRLAQRLRRDRRIVEEAEAAGDVGEGVMSGRPAKRIGGWARPT